jgi:hypothetical protein
MQSNLTFFAEILVPPFDPNNHFEEIAGQLVKMLIQDLVVIFDEMMHELLTARGHNPARFPHSKILNSGWSIRQ